MSLSSVPSRTAHPRIAALALAGLLWTLASLVLGAVPGLGPSMQMFTMLLHLLGMTVLVASGAVYGLLWWRSYLDERLGE